MFISFSSQVILMFNITTQISSVYLTLHKSAYFMSSCCQHSVCLEDNTWVMIYYYYYYHSFALRKDGVTQWPFVQ